METLEVTQRYGKTLSPTGSTQPETPAWTKEVDNPFLHGFFAPTTQEESVDALEVEGDIPPDLFGGYYRNGPNPKYKPRNRYHWFDGDGMVWGIIFEGGKARYRNRWIRTKCLEEEDRRKQSVWPGVLGPFDFNLPISPIKDTANTDLFFRQGTLFATWYESGEVYGVDPESLSTRAAENFGGRLEIPLSAHSKVDPNTGDLIFFSFDIKPPFLHYGVLSPDGAMHIQPIDLPGPRLPHDIGVSENYSILHDFPLIFDPKKLQATGMRHPRYRPDIPTRFGVIPRFGTKDQVRWFDCKPCYMLHVVNCYEDGDELVQIGCRTDDPTLRPDARDGDLAGLMAYLTLQANLYEWRFNLKTGDVKEGPICQLNAEFPTINRQFMGRRNRHAYLQYIPHEAPPTFDALVKYNLDSGRHETWNYGRGVFGSEAPFAPKVGAGDEDDGYVLTFTTDTASWTSKCLIFDAKEIKQGPICQIKLPHRLPGGFHALWVPGDELRRSGEVWD